MFTPPVPLLLNRSTVGSLITFEECIAAIESAFAAHARGEALPPALSHVDAYGGEFHLKAGGLNVGGRSYFALKANGGFFQNRAKHGLPNIQGIVYLADATNGCPLAVMDSRDITLLRTGASTAVATRYLARADAATATICGCGVQGRVQLRALLAVRALKTVYVWSRDAAKATAFATEMAAQHGIEVQPAEQLGACIRKSDIVVTCTSAKKFFVALEDVAPGTFIAAVGADSPEKQEIDPRLLARNAVVCDLTAQCAEVGDLHHALAEGLMTREQVRAELGQVITGTAPSRRSPEEIIVFDSTGTALQDVAAAAAVYEKAMARGVGQAFAFSG